MAAESSTRIVKDSLKNNCKLFRKLSPKHLADKIAQFIVEVKAHLGQIFDAPKVSDLQPQATN